MSGTFYADPRKKIQNTARYRLAKKHPLPIKSQVLNDGLRVEGFWPNVYLHAFEYSLWLTDRSYNRYLAVAARVVRRSLKEGERLKAERRGEMELRFAKWEVGLPWMVDRIEREEINEVRCRTGNKERTRVLLRQMLAPWQKELDKDKDSSRGRCKNLGR